MVVTEETEESRFREMLQEPLTPPLTAWEPQVFGTQMRMVTPMAILTIVFKVMNNRQVILPITATVTTPSLQPAQHSEPYVMLMASVQEMMERIAQQEQITLLQMA